MKRFVRDALLPYDIIAARNERDRNAYLIRCILGSWSNHTAPIIKHNTRGLGIGETSPPVSRWIGLYVYEQWMNEGWLKVRVWRIVDATMEEREHLCYHWQAKIDGEPYPTISVKRLWVMRVVNSLPYRIKGKWCTRATALPCRYVFEDDRNPFRKPNGELKKNETPRTPENRLVCGILRDVTDEVLR